MTSEKCTVSLRLRIDRDLGLYMVYAWFIHGSLSILKFFFQNPHKIRRNANSIKDIVVNVIFQSYQFVDKQSKKWFNSALDTQKLDLVWTLMK